MLLLSLGCWDNYYCFIKSTGRHNQSSGRIVESFSIKQIHHHEPNGEEAEENEESPAAARFGQRAILAHEQARHVDFAVGVGLVVGHIVEYVYCLLFLLTFLDNGTNHKEQHHKGKEHKNDDGELVAVFGDDRDVGSLIGQIAQEGENTIPEGGTKEGVERE